MNLERRYTPAYHSFSYETRRARMSKVVIDMSMSLDGFVAGPDAGVTACWRSTPERRKRAIGDHNGRQAVG